MKSLTVGHIGPSTGWLSAKLGASLKVQSRILAAAKVTAAEMVCHNRERMEAMLRGTLAVPLQYVSLHLPGFQNFPLDAEDSQQAIIDLRTVTNRHHIQGAPVHPDVTPPHVYGLLQAYGIPVCIENMDRQKSCGKSKSELEILGNTHELPYVLDVQHAYEISKDTSGSGITLSTELTNMMLKREIRHLHVSGEITQQGKQLINHAQVHMATNRREIIALIWAVLERAEEPPPIILEGEYLLDVPYDYQARDKAEQEEIEEKCANDMRREIECILNEVNV